MTVKPDGNGHGNTPHSQMLQTSIPQENAENGMNVTHGHPDSIPKMLLSFIFITKLSCDYY
jgi:hypothetical protein